MIEFSHNKLLKQYKQNAIIVSVFSPFRRQHESRPRQITVISRTHCRKTATPWMYWSSPPVPLITGVVVRCRPLGMLIMTDEAGEDATFLTAPINKLCNLYQDVAACKNLPTLTLPQIAQFFEHYNDLEEGKWVKIED